MEALNEFLKKIDFDQDTIFRSQEGKMYTSMWDKNGMYVCNGIYNSPFSVDQFILPPKTILDVMSFATDITQESTEKGKVLRIKSIEVNGTINLHDSVGREGAPKVPYIDENTFIIKADMVAKILRVQNTLNSKLLTIQGTPENTTIIVQGSTPEEHIDFVINSPLKEKASVSLGKAVFDVLGKTSGFDVQVWIVDNKPVKLAISSNAFTVFYYIINE